MEEVHDIHQAVREGYGKIAKPSNDCCAPTCCDPNAEARVEHATKVGYSEEETRSVPAEANLGVGCGNPGALADLKPGDVVVDLGSGAGFDALLAAPKLGANGHFIGVDMTPEMLASARANAAKAGHEATVEFREGLIESLPVESGVADVVISNCVINLSPDKQAVFNEAFRVLKPGGRLAVSDILLSEPLPAEVANNVPAIIACIGSASTEEAYLAFLSEAGFVDVSHTRTPVDSMFDIAAQDPLMQNAITNVGKARARRLASTVFSYAITARKP